MANDAPQERKDLPPEPDGWGALTKYLQQLWGRQHNFDFEQLLNSSSSSASSNLGNLQIWNGGSRC